MRTYSIVLPVRNGGEYVKECIGSILAQTYSAFDLLVVDNNIRRAADFFDYQSGLNNTGLTYSLKLYIIYMSLIDKKYEQPGDF